MKRSTLLPLFLAAAALTGCESAADQERKPAVAAAMLDQSLARCDLQGDSNQNYAQRLREILNDSRTSHLETLQREGVVVCLDRRLNNQRTGIFDAEAEGTYYRTDRVLTVIDSGNNLANERFGSLDAIDRGSLIIDRLSDKVNDHETADMMIAKRTGCGKSCRTTRLYNARGYDTYDLNPQLRTAPLKNGNGW